MTDHPMADLYAQVPSINCKGLCAQPHCRSIAMSTVEQDLIEAEHGVRIPVPGDDDYAIGEPCVALGTALLPNLCRVYPNRPMLCRVFGNAPGLACEFGCVSSAPMTDHEAHTLIQETLIRGGIPNRETLAQDMGAVQAMAMSTKGRKPRRGRQ